MPKTSPRGGFMLLMLIAFTSIILGLSVTFYLYCSRSIDDGRTAVQIANQRLALRAAVNYLAQVVEASGVYSFPNLAPTAYNTAIIVDMNGPTRRSKQLGWYRLKNAGVANSIYITAGVGPSDGVAVPSWPTDDLWRWENRTWYIAEVNTSATPATPTTPASGVPINTLRAIQTPPPAGTW